MVCTVPPRSRGRPTNESNELPRISSLSLDVTTAHNQNQHAAERTASDNQNQEGASATHENQQPSRTEGTPSISFVNLFFFFTI